MKRVSVIVSSIIIFHTTVRPINAVGAAVAILGTFLYSQVKKSKMIMKNIINYSDLAIFYLAKHHNVFDLLDIYENASVGVDLVLKMDILVNTQYGRGVLDYFLYIFIKK